MRSALVDINRDGALDMILLFKTPATGITCGTTAASLTGQTFNKQALVGSEAIVTVGCKK